MTEVIVGLEISLDVGRVLGEELVASGRKPTRGPVDNVDGAGPGESRNGLAGRSNSQIVSAVAVEVSGSQGVTEFVVRLVAVGQPRVLVPELTLGGIKTSRAAVDHVYSAGIRELVRRSEILSRSAYRE